MSLRRIPTERKKRRILRTLAHLPPRSIILAQDETDSLTFPPLQARWGPRGTPPRVVLSGKNAKRVAPANRQHRSIDALVRHMLAYLNNLTTRETLRKAGLLSPNFWLRDKMQEYLCRPA